MSVLAPVQAIGGVHSNTTYVRFGSGIDGQVLRRIGLWAGPSGFGGIRLWLSDSDSPGTFGAMRGTYREFTFQNGERMTRLSLWGNGAGTRSGGIEFVTTAGRTFRHQMTSWNLQQEYPINVASGICVGAHVWWGPEDVGLHALGLTFINELSFAQMTNVRYPTLAFETAGIQAVSIRDINDTNESHTASKQWSNSGSYSATSSSSWAITVGLQYHVGVSISAGIPGIGQVQGEAGWEISASTTHENGSEHTEEWSWARSGTIPPRHWHHFIVTTRRGRIAVPYEATMQVQLRNGARFNYQIRGLYEGACYASLDIVTRNGGLSSDHSSSTPTLPFTEHEEAHGSVTAHDVGAENSKSLVPPPDHDDEKVDELVEASRHGVEGKLGGEIVFIHEDIATSDGKAHEPASEEAT